VTASPTTPASRLEAGSFRDPESRVFYTGGEVFRALSGPGLADWEKLKSSGLYDELAKDGRLVATEQVAEADVPASLPGEWAGVLRHETIPTISYPYEWSFSQLKDAALLQLDLLLESLKRDMILKDSTPYNVQFRGAKPTFIDIGSFEQLRPGEPWVGYRQFCMLYLYPLMLQAYKGVSFQPWLRGSLEGITPADMSALMSGSKTKKGVPIHVSLHARMEKKHAGKSEQVKTDLNKAGFKKELIVANVTKLKKTIQKLSWDPDAEAVWVEYGTKNSYQGTETDEKKDFVRTAAATQRWPRVWDLGANDHRFSLIAAEHADHVVSVDGDEGIVDVVYRKLRDEGRTDITSLVMSLTDMSPDRGWDHRERRTLEARGEPDLILILALIHHICITGNVPVNVYLDWLRKFDAALVIEFPTPDDVMVKTLMSGKREGLHLDYTRDNFERLLGERFDVERTEVLSGGTRVMYFAKPR
jgi:hypothetical protein